MKERGDWNEFLRFKEQHGSTTAATHVRDLSNWNQMFANKNGKILQKDEK